MILKLILVVKAQAKKKIGILIRCITNESSYMRDNHTAVLFVVKINRNNTKMEKESSG